MNCRCGNQTVSIHPGMDMMEVFQTEGTTIIRPVGPTVRVEHLDCGDCRGHVIRVPRGGPIITGGDCGCRDMIRAA